MMLVSQLSFSQKKVITNPVTASCNCADLELYPSFYYKEPETPSTSSLYLRFDFHHIGTAKCKPDFLGSITIARSNAITVTIPLRNLTSYVDTMGQRIFVVTQLHLPDSFRPMTVGGNYKITYSLSYGVKAVCPKTSSKYVRFAKSEPIL